MGYSLAQACREAARMLATLRPRRSRSPRFSIIVIAIVLGATLSGCYVAPAPGPYGHGWCYYHPYRC
jgi:hypothetical protein